MFHFKETFSSEPGYVMLDIIYVHLTVFTMDDTFNFRRNLVPQGIQQLVMKKLEGHLVQNNGAEQYVQ